MSSPIKKLFKNSVIYVIATYMQRMISFVLVPFFTKSSILSLNAFGDYSMIYPFIAFITVLVVMGQDAAYLRFRFHKNEKPENVFMTSFMNLLIISIFFIIVVYVFRFPLNTFLSLKSEKFLLIASVIAMFDILSNSLYNWLRVEERAVSFSIIKIGRFAGELFCNILFVVIFKKGIWGILYANLTIAVINFLFLTYIGKSNFKGVWDKSLAKQMLIFGLPFVPNGIAFVATQVSDRIIITHFINKEAMAIYAASFKWGTLIQFLILAFRNAWQPFFLKTAKEQPEDSPKIFARVIKLFFAGMTILWVLGALFIGKIITTPINNLGSILNDPSYWEGVKIIPIILLSYVYYGFYVTLTPGFYIKKKGKKLALVTITGFFVSLTINLSFISSFGYITAAWANLFAYMVMCVFIVIWGQKIYYIPIDWKYIFKIVLIHTIILTFFYGFNPNVIMSLTALPIIFLFMFILKIFTKTEIQTFAKMLNMFRRGV